MSKLAKKLTAMLLAGMLIIGSASGSVFASEMNVDSGQTSEVAAEEDVAEEVTEESMDEVAREESAVEQEDASCRDTESQETDQTNAAPETEEIEAVETTHRSDDTKLEAESEEDYVEEDAAHDGYTASETENERAIVPDQEADYEDKDVENINEESSEAAVAEEETQPGLIESSEEETVSEETAMGVVASGTCVDNLTWTLDDKGILTISGTGEMTSSPWIEDYTDDITEVVINGGVKSIAESAFEGCWMLKSVTIPESVTSIGNSAFHGCGSLTNVAIPEGVTRIEAYTFADCNSLRKMIIPKGVTRIGNYAFSYCNRLTNVTIPGGVTRIGSHAFYDCLSLTSVTIPESMTKIGDYAFSNCGDLEDVYYTGSEKGWASISIEYGNEDLTNATLYCAIEVLDISNTSITGLVNMVYTGKALTQTPRVVLGSTTLKLNTDYQLSYTNNTNAGTATVTITGIGNFTGTKTATFKINKANQSITVKSTASSIAVGKTATVSIAGAKGTKSYKSSDTSVATVNASTGVVTGKKAGTVTITATSAATANYNAASKSIKITINKVLKKPGNCHFAKWNNSKYTSCRIAWNKVDGADGYQTLLSWTNGSNASSTYVKSNVLYRDCTVHPQHVSQMQVRAFYMLNGQRKFGPWSNVEYITPSPTKLTTTNASAGANLKMNIKWNIIYGCNGYNVFLTTNPNGTWYWNQSTSTTATATSAVITKYRGSALKKNTRYYVRIVTRRQRNGVFCTVPMPSASTNIGSFFIK